MRLAQTHIQAPRVCDLNSRERLARHVEPEGGFNQGAGDALSGGGGCGYTQIRMSASRPDLSCEVMHRSAECQTPFPRRFQSEKHRRRFFRGGGQHKGGNMQKTARLYNKAGKYRKIQQFSCILSVIFISKMVQIKCFIDKKN